MFGPGPATCRRCRVPRRHTKVQRFVPAARPIARVTHCRHCEIRQFAFYLFLSLGCSIWYHCYQWYQCSKFSIVDLTCLCHDVMWRILCWNPSWDATHSGCSRCAAMRLITKRNCTRVGWLEMSDTRTLWAVTTGCRFKILVTMSLSHSSLIIHHLNHLNHDKNHHQSKWNLACCSLFKPSCDVLQEVAKSNSPPTPGMHSESLDTWKDVFWKQSHHNPFCWQGKSCFALTNFNRLKQLQQF